MRRHRVAGVVQIESLASPDHGQAILACHECGLLHRVHHLEAGSKSTCTACGATLRTRHHIGLDGVLALYVAAAILFVVANLFPFMTMRLEGREQTIALFSGGVALWRDGVPVLAVAVLAFAIVIPAVKIAVGLWSLAPVAAGKLPPAPAHSFRLLVRLRPWAMMEVYLLGVIVAYVKLADLAQITLDIAIWAFAALILVLVVADTALDPQRLWRRIAPQATMSSLSLRHGERPVSCHACAQLVQPRTAAADPHCPRCGAALHRRKPDTIARTWALLLTGMLLYIPANALPIMTVVYFGRGEPDTILSGVVELLHAGMWPLALLVFFASILVPMLKMIGLVALLVSTQRGWVGRLRDRAMLYRVIEFVGRWSMIDIFMISILVSLVNLGSIATIEPGTGAVAFAGVVVITMLAAMAFDPRRMWDAAAAEPAVGRALRA